MSAGRRVPRCGRGFSVTEANLRATLKCEAGHRDEAAVAPRPDLACREALARARSPPGWHGGAGTWLLPEPSYCI